jgi:Zn-dependent peptidase ImmA (M78 family)
MTPEFKTMAAHAKFEQSCLEQAKRELEREANSGIDFAVRLLQRAQTIKRQRLLTIDEVMQRIKH